MRSVSRPLRVGIQLPEVEREVRWPEYAAMARAAEEVGFDSIWLGGHLLYRGDGRPPPAARPAARGGGRGTAGRCWPASPRRPSACTSVRSSPAPPSTSRAC